MNKNYITIDIGTGNTKISLFRDDGFLINKISFTNNYYSDLNYEDGTYFLPSEFKEKIIEGVKLILSEHPDVEIHAITSAGARQSIILIDKDGEEIIGLPNIDNRGKKYISEIIEPGDIYRNTGKWVTEDFPAAKILGYRKVYEKDFENIDTFTSLSEWVGYFFTGIDCIEPSQAGETQLFNIHTNKFCKNLSRKYGLESLKFPKVLDAGDVLGKVCDFWAEDFPQLRNAVFIVGGADTQIALEGKNLPGDSFAIVSGTTTPIIVHSEEAVYDEKERVWVDINFTGKGYLLEVNPGATGLNYQRFKESFLSHYTYEELEKLYGEIEEVKVTSSLTSLRFTEKLSQKRGGFFMKSPFSADITPVDLGWSILGDIACSIYEQLIVLEEIAGFKKDEIFGVGSGLKSKTLCQMISDLTKKTLILPYEFENGTSVGLLYLCNKHFNITNDSEDEDTIYRPQKDSLIQEYYRQWKINKTAIC